MNSMAPAFDASLSDAQGTAVTPVAPKDFDLEAYADYALALDEGCRKFWDGKTGILVHRRFRVPEVFAASCKNMELSLALQLGALKMSMAYPMDVPNFLEPWYGIGTVAAAFGANYRWNRGLAPVAEPPFRSVEEALEYEPMPIAETEIGRHTLNMVEFFLEQTKGRLPLSFSDVQSPLNAASSLVDTGEFFMAVLDRPDRVKELLRRVTDLFLEFLKKQADMIGANLVKPGHGFSSSRVFSGIGASDDSSTMLSPELYAELCVPFMERLGERFGGIVYHSCGNWSPKIEVVKNLRGLLMVDGAFTAETDPDPNPPEAFRTGFSGTGVCVNARMVGSPGRVLHAIDRLGDGGMKLIVVTYCATPEEQKGLYEKIHGETRA